MNDLKDLAVLYQLADINNTSLLHYSHLHRAIDLPLFERVNIPKSLGSLDCRFTLINLLDGKTIDYRSSIVTSSPTLLVNILNTIPARMVLDHVDQAG
jgi:hypothetical protein